MEDASDERSYEGPGIGISRIGANTILTPRTSLTFENCGECENLLTKFIEEHQTAIILDCKSVEFLDSRALEMMTHVHDELRDRGGLLKIANLNSVCRDILVVTRLINVLHVYDDVPEAVRSKL